MTASSDVSGCFGDVVMREVSVVAVVWERRHGSHRRFEVASGCLSGVSRYTEARGIGCHSRWAGVVFE